MVQKERDFMVSIVVGKIKVKIFNEQAVAFLTM